MWRFNGGGILAAAILKTTIMDKYQLTYEQFKALPSPEHGEFISKLLFAINNKEACFQYAQLLVNAAEDIHLYEKIKFNEDVLKDVNDLPQSVIDLLTPLS